MSQTYNCKDDHIKMTTITTIGFTSAMQLAYAVIIQSSDRQGTLTHQPYKPLWQFHCQLMFIFLMFLAVDVIWWDFFLQCTHIQIAFVCLGIYMWLGFIYSFILSVAAWTCSWRKTSIGPSSSRSSNIWKQFTEGRITAKTGKLSFQTGNLKHEKQQKYYIDQVERLCCDTKYNFKIMFCQWHDAGLFEWHKDVGWIIKVVALIPPPTIEVECSFSLMNLISKPLRKCLLPDNLQHCMQICKHGKLKKQ